MNDQDRGAMLLQEETLEKTVTALRQELGKMGGVYAELGNALRTSPDKIGFANAPSPLGNSPFGITTLITWNEIPEKTNVAEKIQELRGALRQLEDVQRRLGRQR